MHKIDIKHEFWGKKYEISYGQFTLDNTISNNKDLQLTKAYSYDK